MLSLGNLGSRSSEVDEAKVEEDFDTAASMLAGTNIDITDALRLKFYALYKQGSIGPCNIAKPSFINVVAKAKWQAWTDLGQLKKLEAMVQYTSMVRDVIAGSIKHSVGKENENVPDATMVPIVSRPQMQECDVDPCERNLIFYATEGDIDHSVALLSSGNVEADFCDSNGRTALHFAADRGHLELVRVLLEKYSASVNIADADGLTPLHNACCSEHISVIKLLLSHGANIDARDYEGEVPADGASMEVINILNESC